jgi:DNA-binding MarR family transcriptional regulator
MPDRKKIAKEIIQIMPLIMRNISADLRCHRAGLAPAHMRLLGELFERPRSLSELAELQAVTLATISNTITILVDRGWVVRMAAPADRRVVVACITPEGRTILSEIHKQLENHILESIAALPEEDLESLEKGVGVLNQVLEQADWRLPVDECLDDRASINRMDADRA